MTSVLKKETTHLKGIILHYWSSYYIIGFYYIFRITYYYTVGCYKLLTLPYLHIVSMSSEALSASCY